jgi:Kef-type K+ transport system membrane component KefB
MTDCNISILASLPPASDESRLADILLALAVVLVAAKLGGELAIRVGQPAVLGELIAGVILGSLDLVGVEWITRVKTDSIVDSFAQLGVILLLFEVGLESTVRDMLKVGLPSLMVAVLGVAAPFALGWGVGALVLPDRSVYVHAFLGATLTATSVGITARVLKDLGQSRSPEARVILGAAVIDDVLGLIVLAAVSGAIAAVDRGEDFSWVGVGSILAKSAVFLTSALLLGAFLSRRLFHAASKLRGRGVLLVTALAFCFALSYAAGAIGLAPIVGAYAAGLLLEDTHFKGFRDRGEETLERLVQPVSALFVPVFFVVMGMHVDLTAWTRLSVLGLAGLLTLAAILGKQLCSLGALGVPLDRLSVGIGMVPRGEVGLIFANVGLGLTLAGEAIVDQSIFAAVVVMVLLTTMVTPPALKWSLSRSRRRRRPPPFPPRADGDREP